MIENGPVRKRPSGEGDATPYLRVARVMLGQLKERMEAYGIPALVQRKTFPNGVEISVSSRYGQDTIDIHVPGPGGEDEKEIQPPPHLAVYSNLFGITDHFKLNGEWIEQTWTQHVTPSFPFYPNFGDWGISIRDGEMLWVDGSDEVSLWMTKVGDQTLTAVQGWQMVGGAYKGASGARFPIRNASNFFLPLQYYGQAGTTRVLKLASDMLTIELEIPLAGSDIEGAAMGATTFAVSSWNDVSSVARKMEIFEFDGTPVASIDWPVFDGFAAAMTFSEDGFYWLRNGVATVKQYTEAGVLVGEHSIPVIAGAPTRYYHSFVVTASKMYLVSYYAAHIRVVDRSEGQLLDTGEIIETPDIPVGHHTYLALSKEIPQTIELGA